ncbi:MAG: fibrobacter succinogenes major paralogous domain-containing protein [Fibromonadaceae bacterium]|jgi:uncharacterized protein (TIGR02145 family)|nr:fibrobacter succinogenes major paralogous domain-containing protein [Fibromonadaceae bacterium]
MRKFLFTALAVFAILGCSSNDDVPCMTCGDSYNTYSSSSSWSSSSVPTQSGIIRGTPVYYGGETYETVVIGSQTWMARNLNYDVSGSKCYNNDPANCAKYGRLYDWATAMGISSSYNNSSYNPSASTKYKGICPSGWHIPNNAEWDKLVRYVDGTSGTSSPYDSPTAGRYLKATSGWNSNGNGNDKYGFSALPGGYGGSGGFFDFVGRNGYWWTASEYSSDYAYGRSMYYRLEDVDYNDGTKNYMVSVRCLQD